MHLVVNHLEFRKTDNLERCFDETASEELDRRQVREMAVRRALLEDLPAAGALLGKGAGAGEVGAWIGGSDGIDGGGEVVELTHIVRL